MSSVSVPMSVDADQEDHITSISRHVTLSTLGASTSFGNSAHTHALSQGSVAT